MNYLVRDGNWRLRLTGGRRIGECRHRRTISTVNAGLERTVCEVCGQVRVRFVESTVRIFPDNKDTAIPPRNKTAAPERRPRACGVCDAPAVFLIPRGVACAEHAWREASRQQIMGSEPWIPITIDQRANAG